MADRKWKSYDAVSLDVIWAEEEIQPMAVAIFSARSLYVFPTELSGASWPDQLVHQNVTWNWMYIIVWIDRDICIILTCDVYLIDIQVIKIWDFRSTVQPDLGKPSRPRQDKPVAWETLRSVPGHVTKRQWWAKLQLLRYKVK